MLHKIFFCTFKIGKNWYGSFFHTEASIVGEVRWKNADSKCRDIAWRFSVSFLRGPCLESGTKRMTTADCSCHSVPATSPGDHPGSREWATQFPRMSFETVLGENSWKYLGSARPTRRIIEF